MSSYRSQNPFHSYSNGSIMFIDKEVARVHFDKRTGRKWLYIHRDGKQVSTGIDVMHIWHRKEDLYALVADLMNEQVNQ